jgi:hypothetical protein
VQSLVTAPGILHGLFVVFVSHLSRPPFVEAPEFAKLVGVTEYEARLALVSPQPSIVQTTSSRDRANDTAALLRARGHGIHVFDEESFTPSERMTKMDDFRLDADGVRRVADGELLPYGDVFAILRAVHVSSSEVERPSAQRGLRSDMLDATPSALRVVSKNHEREQVAYFFRRSGERPWILRERHARYDGLGAERKTVAFQNFVFTIDRMREASPMAIYDDRLVRRRVAERVREDTMLRATYKTSHEAMDLLAHLLAMQILTQGGSPYR